MLRNKCTASQRVKMLSSSYDLLSNVSITNQDSGVLASANVIKQKVTMRHTSDKQKRFKLSIVVTTLLKLSAKCASRGTLQMSQYII